MNEAQLVRTIKVLIEKGDAASEKAQQFYVAAGQHLKTLKDSHTKNWKEWEQLLRDRCQLSTGRASELMQIADGRKTVADIRAKDAEKHRRLRQQYPIPSGRPEELPKPIKVEVINELTKTKYLTLDVAHKPEQVAAPVYVPTKVPEVPQVADQIPPHVDPAPVDPLETLQIRWDATSAATKQQFVAANITELDEILARHRKAQVSTVADRAIERAMPPPFAPVRDDFPDLPEFLDRTVKGQHWAKGENL